MCLYNLNLKSIRLKEMNLVKNFFDLHQELQVTRVLKLFRCSFMTFNNDTATIFISSDESPENSYWFFHYFHHRLAWNDILNSVSFSSLSSVFWIIFCKISMQQMYVRNIQQLKCSNIVNMENQIIKLSRKSCTLSPFITGTWRRFRKKHRCLM